MAARANLSGATAPTPAFGDNSTNIATTAFVTNATDGINPFSTSGGTAALTQAQASMPVMLVTGTLTSNAVIVVPNAGVYTVANRTTGAFTVTVKTAAGTGVVVTQGLSNFLVADGTNVMVADTDINGVAVGGVTPGPGAFTSLSAVGTIGVSGPAGSYRSFNWSSGTLFRASMQLEASAETGANAGSNWQVNMLSDTGGYLNTPILITRATGNVAMPLVTISGGAVNGATVGATTPGTGAFTTLTSTGYHLRSLATGLTAAGTTQAAALVLTKQISVVATAAASSGVVLPNAGIGAELVIINRGANTMNIYPPTGGLIDALAANAATTAATLTSKRFVQATATQYYTV